MQRYKTLLLDPLKLPMYIVCWSIFFGVYEFWKRENLEYVMGREEELDRERNP